MSRDFDDALGRARAHLQRAFLEGLEAATALVEAASIVRRDPGADGSLMAEIVRGLDRAVRELRAAGRLDLPPGLLEPLEKALDAEIARWEARSKRDADARPILRAFLGLRELLFELTRSGAARSTAPRPNGAPRDAERPRPRATRPPPPRRRVQRFDVEG